jgi:hypothetical protein
VNVTVIDARGGLVRFSLRNLVTPTSGYGISGNYSNYCDTVEEACASELAS